MILPCIQNLLSSSAAVCEEASETTSSRTATQRARFPSRCGSEPIVSAMDPASRASTGSSIELTADAAENDGRRGARVAVHERRASAAASVDAHGFFFCEQSVTHMDGRGPFLLWPTSCQPGTGDPFLASRFGPLRQRS